jgi:hypothetical protein
MNPTGIVVTVLLCAAPVVAQFGVRIVRVPDQVVLPAPPGANLLLEVEIEGIFRGRQFPVWIATDAISVDRVPLEQTGTAMRFQLNLADARVQALLPAARDQGELIVLATCDSFITHSIPIRWARTAANAPPVYGILRKKDGSTRTTEVSTRAWLDPRTFASFEVQGAGERQSAAVARIGELEVPLVRRAEQGLWVLENTALLQEQADRGHSLEVEVKRGTASSVFRFDLAPSRLALPDGPVTFTLAQRKRALVPGSHDWLTVAIDDITMGQVLLEVTDADGHVVVPQRSVIERDAVELPLAGEHAVLTVDRLVNLLIGDDFAELTVRPASGFVPDRIAQLIHAVAASKDTFVREGEDYPGPMAAQFLVARLGPKQRGITVDAFVDDVASKSLKTGAPYHVRRPDGTTVTMQEWLRAELQRLEASEKNETKAPPAIK